MERYVRLKAIIVFATLTIGLVYTTAQAQTPATPINVVLPAGASVSVSCAADTLTVEQTTAATARLSCAKNLMPTVTPTP
jgi:hypothetical protein